MTRPRSVLAVSYRILDPSGHTVEVVTKRGINRRYLLWLVERYVSKKYGKGMKIHSYKVVEETD